MRLCSVLCASRASTRVLPGGMCVQAALCNLSPILAVSLCRTACATVGTREQTANVKRVLQANTSPQWGAVCAWSVPLLHTLRLQGARCALTVLSVRVPPQGAPLTRRVRAYAGTLRRVYHALLGSTRQHQETGAGPCVLCPPGELSALPGSDACSQCPD